MTGDFLPLKSQIIKNTFKETVPGDFLPLKSQILKNTFKETVTGDFRPLILFKQKTKGTYSRIISFLANLLFVERQTSNESCLITNKKDQRSKISWHCLFKIFISFTYDHEVDSDLGRAESVDAFAVVDTAVLHVHRTDLQVLAVHPEPEISQESRDNLTRVEAFFR